VVYTGNRLTIYAGVTMLTFDEEKDQSEIAPQAQAGPRAVEKACIQGNWIARAH